MITEATTPKLEITVNKFPKVLCTEWRLYTYDVWGNPKDGFVINDVFKKDLITIPIKATITICNKGTDRAYKLLMYVPTKYAISKALGVSRRWFDPYENLEHICLVANNGKPICELTLESHTGLQISHNDTITRRE